MPPSISQYYGGAPMRAVPDIAMPADPNTGMEVGETQVFPDGTYWDQYRIGGTSLSTPLWSAIIADRDSFQGHRSGNINPLVYTLFNLAPNFYFHVTTTYDILRHNGVEIGKRDFLGV